MKVYAVIHQVSRMLCLVFWRREEAEEYISEQDGFPLEIEETHVLGLPWEISNICNKLVKVSL